MTIDRRVARTRTALYDALISLILSKGYVAITVQDLIDEANVGRATFYAHFTSKEDLLARSLERVRDILVDAVSREEESWSLALITHVAQFRPVYVAIAGIEASDILRGAIRRIIAAFVVDHLQPVRGIPAELQAQHVAGVFMTLLGWWLDRRPSLRPSAVDELFRRLLAGEVRIAIDPVLRPRSRASV